ncbi:MAG TPA: choice-of-anchor Q domain-containing protein, partial [Verrucomicrobiae bacterium]|nr:choice-of-anchor Q domain-containing protein [Verrucomicrobiae bacterium]
PVDQRGVSRPLGAGYDIGAFEFGAITFAIRGQVLIGTNGLSGVTVTARSGNSAGGVSGVSDFAGNYVIPNLLSNSYSVFPLPFAFFTPTNIPVSIGAQSVTGINFQAKTAGTAALAPATNHTVQFSFSGIPNQTYRFQVSTNLSSSTNWLTLTNLSSGASGAFNFTDAITNSPIRFYRAVTP